jgi:hypothetical protein
MARINLSSLMARTAAKPGSAGMDRTPQVNSAANAYGTSNGRGGAKDAGLPMMAALAAPAAAGSGPSDLASIREILLGALPEQYERQIERLEVKIAEGAADLRIALSALERRLEKRIVGVDAATRTSNGELRQQLLEEMRVVNEAVQTYHAKAMRRIEEGLQEIQSSKLDQATFSSFLGSLARHLGREDAARNDAQEAR